MKVLASLGLTTTVFIAFHVAIVCGVDPPSAKGASKENPSSTGATVAQNQQENIIKLKCSEIYNYYESPKYSYYSYDTNSADKSKMALPKTVEKVKFNGVELVFEDTSKIPDLGTCSSIDVIMCEHKCPLMVRLIVGNDNQYFYYLNSETNTLKNTAVVDTTYSQKTDPDTGVIYYVPPGGDAVKCIKTGVAKKFKQLFEEQCKSHKKVELSQNTLLEVFITTARQPTQPQNEANTKATANQKQKAQLKDSRKQNQAKSDSKKTSKDSDRKKK